MSQSNTADGSYIDGEKVSDTVLTNTNPSYSVNYLFTRASSVENMKGKFWAWNTDNAELPTFDADLRL